jgi:hypothetical protein
MEPCQASRFTQLAGNFMNLATSLGLYAAVNKELSGTPFSRKRKVLYPL